MMTYGGQVFHIDPVGRAADYGAMPKADVVLVTHEHGDHLDPTAIDQLRKPGTVVLLTAAGAERVSGSSAMENGDTRTLAGVQVEAVPAYNLVHMRSPGQPYHSKGSANGYVLTFGDTRVYIAGDTENTPEMKALQDIDIAFLPMNLPFTMTPEMVADAVVAFRPKVLYPYHFGSSDTGHLADLLRDQEGIELRLRNMP